MTKSKNKRAKKTLTIRIAAVIGCFARISCSMASNYVGTLNQTRAVNPISLISDTYERKARLYPALLLAAPVIIVVDGDVVADTVPRSIIAGMSDSAVRIFLTQPARDAGTKREKQLFVEWGGLPSIAIFRHSDDRLDPVTKAHYHKKLNALVKDAKAPTVDEENVDPAAADVIYSAWSHYLRVSTRTPRNFHSYFTKMLTMDTDETLWAFVPSASFCVF